MFMPRFLKDILCVFCSCCLCSSAKADDLDPISRLYLTNKKYAKNIEVKAYLVTKDQIAKLFREENGEVIQRKNKELFNQEVFLLVRVKNKGEHMSFGLLNCKIPNRGVPITIDIEMMPASMKGFHDSIIFIGRGFISNDNASPHIEYKWKSLYTM
jgi:hypothetical protein